MDREKSLLTKVTIEESELVKKAAAKEYMSVSAFVRKSVVLAAREVNNGTSKD